MKYLPPIVFVSILLAHKTYISADAIPPKPTTVKGLIVYFSQQQGVDQNKMLALSLCESSYRYDAVGDHGLAHGAFQYHEDTFNRFSKMIGQHLDYHSTEDQALLTSWIMKNHPEEMRSWSCWKKVS